MTEPSWALRLASALAGRPSLSALLELVLGEWPEHEPFLSKGMRLRSPPLLDMSDRMARALLDLAGDKAINYARDYRALCAVIRDEELAFARTGRYRYSTFAEAQSNVYSDAAFMSQYMNGLLFSHVLWNMHASSLHFFRDRVSARVKAGGSVLEIGSGHGLLLFLAMRDLKMASATAWDLSEVSLEQTRHALERLGVLGKASFAIQDMHAVQPGGETFDLVILSHILEHLEDPVAGLRQVRHLLARGGIVFINIPFNAPMPDHLVLLRSPQDVQNLISSAGFNIVEMGVHTTQGAQLGTALKQQTAVTCSIVAEPA